MPDSFKSIVDHFKKLRQNVCKGKRAPHKPLLALVTLAKYKAGSERMIPFEKIEQKLKELLEYFGPARQRYSPEYPFWHLKNDGLWELSLEQLHGATKAPSAANLKKAKAKGGFPEETYRLLTSDNTLINELASTILDEYFPDTYHEDILSEIGLDIKDCSTSPLQKKRDPEFRQKILTIYEYRCAICGFNMRFGNSPICLEAAHIMWHQVGGPAIEQNGIALCSMHHKMFDRGAFTINDSNKVRVSRNINGNECVDQWLWQYDGKSLLLPRTQDYYPKDKFLSWHFREVFQEIYKTA